MKTEISSALKYFLLAAVILPALCCTAPAEIRGADAPVWIQYTGDVSAWNTNGTPAVFSKISGPDWLAVSSNGTFSGMPENSDIGENRFVIQYSAAGGTESAEFLVDVIYHSRYPRFSWDTVPVYIHFGKTPAALTDQEVQFVAGVSDFVCLEKSHARTQFGSTEAGTAHDAARLKAANPAIKVLYYWNSFLNYQMYDACAEVDKHPDWILRDGAGVPVLKDGRLEQYNILNPEFRQWWAEEAAKGISNHCDGVFVDALAQPLRPIWKSYWPAGTTTNDLIAASCDQFIRARAAAGENALIFYNGIRSVNGSETEGFAYLPYADGAIVEHFAAFNSTDKESIARDIDAVIAAGRAGKITVIKGWPDADFIWTNTEKMTAPYEELALEARNKIAFSLACYLIAAQPYSYFGYSWGYREGHGALVDFPEYRMPLGKPLGDAVRTGWIYTRAFEHVSVTVDIENRTALISGAGAHYFNEWIGSVSESFTGDIDNNGINNLVEYAFGGAAFAGREIIPEQNVIEITYNRRRDAAARGLSYTLEAASNLLSAAWSSEPCEETGAGRLNSEFEIVTNRVTLGDSGFVRLNVRIEP